MKYAGMSDKLSSVGIYEYNSELDKNRMGAKLIAQMIFFLVTGFYNRKGDYPSGLKSDKLCPAVAIKSSLRYDQYNDRYRDPDESRRNQT